MKSYLVFIAALGMTFSVAAKVRFVAPQKDALVLGEQVKVQLKGCKFRPHATAVFDNEEQTLRFSPSFFKKHWHSEVELNSRGKKIVTIEGKCGRREFAHRFQVDNSVMSWLRPLELVAQNFMSAHPPEEEKWDWGPAVMLFGMTKFAEQSQIKDEILDYIRRYHIHWMVKGTPKIDWADKCPSALSAYYLAKEQGEYFAWPNIEKVIHYIKTGKRNQLGSLDHFGEWTMSKFYPSSIWVDSLMMWALISVKYGIQEGDDELLDFGVIQPLIFANKLQNDEGLFYHAWNVKKDRPMPRHNVPWLRGNGWVLTAFAEILGELPDSHPLYPDIAEVFKRLAYATLKYRLKSGLWDTVIAQPGYAYEESSGSALLGYGYAKGVQLGLLPASFLGHAQETYESLVSRLKKTDQGRSMTEISWLTMPYGKFIYKLIPRKRDLSYGLGALFLLGAQLDQMVGMSSIAR